MGSKNQILNEIDSGKGYIIDAVPDRDFIIFKKIIERQYREKLLRVYPQHKELINNTAIEDYHTLTFPNHKVIWSKEQRTFDESDVLIFKNSNFFKGLVKLFGPIIITNEDKTRTEEIYWRLVRPKTHDDVGPLHADSWFWSLHNGLINENFRRLKIWISIFNQAGENGFRLITGSQKKSYNFNGELRDGKIKPISDPKLEADVDLILAPSWRLVAVTPVSFFKE